MDAPTTRGRGRAGLRLACIVVVVVVVLVVALGFLFDPYGCGWELAIVGTPIALAAVALAFVLRESDRR